MEPSIHIQQNSKNRGSQKKTLTLPDVRVMKAKHLYDYTIQITFRDGRVSVVDFTEILNKFAQGDYAKWRQLRNFKRFRINDGQLVWGRNWDLMFDPDELYKGKIKVTNYTLVQLKKYYGSLPYSTKQERTAVLKAIENKYRGFKDTPKRSSSKSI